MLNSYVAGIFSYKRQLLLASQYKRHMTVTQGGSWENLYKCFTKYN